MMSLLWAAVWLVIIAFVVGVVLLAFLIRALERDDRERHGK